MNSVEDNITSLSRAIMNEARGEADQVLEDARAKAEATRRQAQEQADAARKDTLDRAQREAERIRSQKVASTQLKARTMQLDSREKLLNKVFTTVQQELPSIAQWSDYEEIARSLLREALNQLKASEVVVRADKQTQAHLSQQFLKDISDELKVQIQVGEPLAQGTGVIVETANGRLQFDNTLETRLQRLWNGMRSPVYHLLMGETL